MVPLDPIDLTSLQTPFREKLPNNHLILLNNQCFGEFLPNYRTNNAFYNRNSRKLGRNSLIVALLGS